MDEEQENIQEPNTDPIPLDAEEPLDIEQLDQMLEQVLDHTEDLDWDLEPVSIPMSSEVKNEVTELADEQVQQSEDAPASKRPEARRLTPREILEAALFVGGTKLTLRSLRKLLNDDFDADYIENCIRELNDQYESEERPYLIQTSEQGYKLHLKPEYESVRRKVFGYGPREVKLSQDALEILSLVAYHQPISREEVDRLSKRKASGTLNQLLRRELISLHRDPETREVTYRTEPRFLEIFGLANLDDLPRPEYLAFK
ncbi:MAG: SMC-Scp complex subunit ScpB [Planctomycetaceae bacterium]|nr:SMC-Scp complex subunit ScpB [Planctomycetaceae bacterium]